MSFLYPLFLLAGLSIAIPIIIHLFNLRRYKTVYFPNTRFLKNIQLHSQKQSQLKYKWLLALRILFLLFLILAFAQPFFARKDQTAATDRLQVIFIDNSSSMSVKKGARSLLDIAKDAARNQIQNVAPGTKFFILTSDRPLSYQPMPAEKAVGALNTVDITSVSRNASSVFATVQGLVQSEAAEGADLYYYSDFQRNAFPAHASEGPLNQVNFHGIPVRTDVASNVFIDTAFFTSPVLHTNQSNRLVIRSKLVGKGSADAPVVQLSINGQVKTAASLSFDEKNESIDTLSFQVNTAGWQRLMLTVADAAVRYDDTFRITARSASNLSVLVLNESQPNPYIQAAFRAYNGFRMDQKKTGEQADWKQYNLIIFNGITRVDEVLGKRISEALQQGQSICIFPGRTTNLDALNTGLSRIGDIRFTGVDTATQTAATLQQGSELVRDLFERIPDNVQLPVANWHYNIRAGLSANQQSILSFRNGDPLLAQYSPSRGKLYLASTSADLQSGNFPGSYFFAPFLYQMTAQSKGGDVYAITAGEALPVYLPMTNAGERNMVHLYADGVDIIPPQRPSGAGLDVYLAQAVQQPGFYTLAASGADSTSIALNQNRAESYLELWNLDKLQENWSGNTITWSKDASSGAGAGQHTGSSFPLWKVCVILALLMLAAESYLLAAANRNQTVAPR